MAGQGRVSRSRRITVEREEKEEESSNESSYEDEPLLDADDSESDVSELVPDVKPKAKLKIKLKPSQKPKNTCKVCGSKLHKAGFVGSLYIDCPDRPCFLCREPGHTTATCPHRITPHHGVIPYARPKTDMENFIRQVQKRELGGHAGNFRKLPPIPDRIDAAILQMHSRRICVLEFHPTNQNLLLSGDKRGEIGVWNYEKVYDKKILPDTHHYLVSSIKFMAGENFGCYSSSLDGTVAYTDLETAVPHKLCDLNPDGWQDSPSTWRSFYAMDISGPLNLILCADDIGNVHRLDPREKHLSSTSPHLIHNKGSKVVSLHVNPADSNLFISAGNDWTARIWDLRRIDNELAVLDHPRVVNSAYFSPVSGSKILTTCQDNRLRTWDYLFGNLSNPSREIVHSHDFNRYLTAFRAEWDPRDPFETLAICGRYISDDYNGIALHPIDIIDVTTGSLTAALVDKDLVTISPVNKIHHSLDLMATGSARSIFVWKPSGDDEEGKSGFGDRGGIARCRQSEGCRIVGGDKGKSKPPGKNKKKGVQVVKKLVKTKRKVHAESDDEENGADVDDDWDE